MAFYDKNRPDPNSQLAYYIRQRNAVGSSGWKQRLADEIESYRIHDGASFPRVDWLTTYWDLDSQDRVALIKGNPRVVASKWQKKTLQDLDRKIEVEYMAYPMWHYSP